MYMNMKDPGCKNNIYRPLMLGPCTSTYLCSLSRSLKPDFFPQSQMHLDITNQTANLKYILEKIKVEWGEDYVIVTNNGIELEDSPATQGTD